MIKQLTAIIKTFERPECAQRLIDSIRTRYDTDSEEDILHRLKTEDVTTYKNPDGEVVDWFFDQIITLEHDPEFKDGEELIGFINEI